jgi:hypothetical protein
MFNEFNEGSGGAIPDLTKPSKEALIHLLRNREKWPEGFSWEFTSTCRCAMGIAHQVWPEKVPVCTTLVVSNAIGINSNTGMTIFSNGRGPASTPEDIADLLEMV